MSLIYGGLKANVIAGHIYGPADASGFAGELASLIPEFGTTGAVSGTVQGSTTVSGAIVQHLLDGMTYVNIHPGTKRTSRR